MMSAFYYGVYAFVVVATFILCALTVVGLLGAIANGISKLFGGEESEDE